MQNINKIFIGLLIIGVWTKYSFAQSISSKPNLNLTNIKGWPHVLSPRISDNGKFYSYLIDNIPINKRTLVVGSKLEGLQKNIVGNSINEHFFSSNNSALLYVATDTLKCLSLKNGEEKKIGIISSLKTDTPNGSSTQWIAYKKKHDPLNQLEIFDVNNLRRYKVDNVIDFEFYKFRASLIFISKSDSISKIGIVNLLNGSVKFLWESTTCIPSKITIDYSRNQIAFNTKQPNGTIEIWNWNSSLQSAKRLISKLPGDLSSKYTLTKGISFSKNGKWMFFQVNPVINKIVPDSNLTNIDVWNFKDFNLNPEQKRKLISEPQKSINAVLSLIKPNEITILDDNDDNVQTSPNDITGSYVIVKSKNTTPYWWKLDSLGSFYLQNLETGIRSTIAKVESGLDARGFSFSPNGEWLVYFDARQKSWCSYNLRENKRRVLTEKLGERFDKEPSYVDSSPVENVAFWDKRDQFFLIYDNYDIWKVDPSQHVQPINLTSGYGKANNIKFRIAELIITKKTPKLLLSAFNVKTIYNGFFTCDITSSNTPKQLYYGPFSIYKTSSQIEGSNNFTYDRNKILVKAKFSNTWIILRQSNNQCPNLFITNDLRTIKPISNIQPQTKVNWLNAELIQYKTKDNILCSGILYKPENFDPQKKYPLIFTYYERLSHRLYEFPYPGLTDNNIDIPYFVSNDYLVFTPDISYSIGAKTGVPVGKHAFNSIMGAVNKLGELPYINMNKLALAGHSFGALQTGYIVTHSTLFKAVVAAAGSTDPISAYLSLTPTFSEIEHYDKQILMEKGHEQYGATPWEQPQLYRENSTVLAADRISSPMLIMHNPKDNNIPWRQGVELFMAMHRLNKACWLLQYDDSSHSVYDRDAVDYTIRVRQFFDHYLKDGPAPLWMTRGVPAELKNVSSGLGFELKLSCKPDCEICKTWNKTAVKNGLKIDDELASWGHY